MDVPAVDSKLLVVFDAIMTERSVTRAAERVGLSQPAISNALARLRDLLDDELFVRVTGGMRPTPRALELSLPVHNVLLQLQSVFRPARFQAENAKQTFNLAVSDHCAVLILPALLERLRRLAPGIQVRVRPKSDAVVISQLVSGEIDLAIGIIHAVPSVQLSQLTLFHETYICAMHASHPLASSDLGFEMYMKALHLVTTPAGDPIQSLDHELFKIGHERQIAMTINQSLLAPLILERSELVLTSYHHLVATQQSFAALILKPLPFDAPPLEVKLFWHSLFDHNPAHEWLRSQVEDIAKDCVDRTPPLAPNGTIRPSSAG